MFSCSALPFVQFNENANPNWDPIRKHPRFAKLVVQLPTHP